MMDNHNWRASPGPQGGGGGPGPGGVGGGGDAPPPEAGDWRSELSADSRDRIVSKIMETLKKHLPVSGPEGLNELKKIAVRFEQKIYHVASSQPDYLRKISLKMLTMESKSQSTIPNPIPSNSSVSINKPSDTAAVNQPHPGQQVPNQLPSNQSQARQQLPVPNMQNNLPSGASQGQQSQPTTVQQPSMSHLRQPTQLQTQVGLQQQANQLQREQRHQVPNSMLQQQNMIDQQKQLYQSQRTLTETSSMSVDTSQAGSANGGDWREEVYQKLQVMKENYMPDLNDLYQKVMLKLQQDSLPQQPKSEQIEKLKMFKAMLERIITFIQVPKNEISITYKDKLGPYEKQILGVLTSHRPRKPAPGQLPPHDMQPVPQQQTQPRIAQIQSHENQRNPQLPQLNIQGSAVTMQQNNASNLQHNSLSSVSGFSGAQQNMMNSLQANSSMESGQGNTLSSFTQVGLGSMPRNPVSAQHQVKTGAMSHQSGVSMLQSNVSGLQQTSSMIQQQHLKPQQDQQMMQQQKIKQHIQQRHLQQHLLHHQQQLQQQAKQQLPAQLQAMGQLHQMSDGNDVKLRQGMEIKRGVFPPANQRPNYANPLKHVTPFPSSAASPQLPQKDGTPLQSANSPFVVPSPSTPTPLAPSPMPGDLEKPNPAVSSLSNVGNVGHQAMSASSLIAAPSLAIGTPGISASPLLAEFSYPDGVHGNSNTGVSCKSSVTEQPIERLMRMVKALSSQALSAGVNDIRSVVSMVDRIAGSAPGNGSRAAVGEDLVAMTKCRLQAKTFTTQDGAGGVTKMKRYTSAVPSSIASTGSGEGGFLQFIGMESSDLESTATSAFKRPRFEVNHVLVEEIRYINQRLIDTVVDIRDEEVDPSAAAAVAEGGEGVIVECSYNAVSLSPDFKTHYESAQMSRIQPLRLLVPANYPNCSPLLLDKLPVEVSKEYEDLSAKTKARFSISLRNLSQPMSLKEIALTWDKCVRGVIQEYAQQHGGGSFSSKYGTWESCMTAA
ncbi:hypothetical protein MLD38_003616 [Melastoma candidum]|uniref:Uncharacterized protein n=1 Tax=Melastoma candidum TaxID=119954 RepID=A0ACB9S6B5_9MYRT|nr:hypothetical protein MLD38_003616 [Melastoma candidum]